MSEASFEENKGVQCQLGCIILAAGDRKMASIINFGLNCRYRITRSVTTAEVHELALAFVYEFFICDTIKGQLQRTAELKAFANRRDLFNAMKKDS